VGKGIPQNTKGRTEEMKKLIIMLIPKFVRKSIHAAIMSEVKEQTKPETIAVHAMVGIGFVIGKGAKRVSDDKMVTICEGFELGGDTLKKVAVACNPNSENGKEFSDSEKAEIQSNLCRAVEKALPQDVVDKVNDEISYKVSEYLGLN